MLPSMLLKRLGAHGDGWGTLIGAVITAPELTDVDGLLERAGIIDLDGIERP